MNRNREEGTMRTDIEKAPTAGKPDTTGRRSLLRSMVGSAMGGSALISTPAFAQKPLVRNIEPLRIIGRTADAARNQLIAAATPPLGEAPPVFEKRFRAVQRDLLERLGSTLREVPENQRINYVCGEHIDLAIEIQSHNVGLIQPPSIVIIEITRPVPVIQPTPQESLLQVLWDIFWDTLGINQSIRGALTRLFSGGPWAQLFDELVAAVARRDAALIALQAERLLAAIFGREALAAIARAVGEAELRRILVSAAARFVPFIGWAFWIASFLLALHRNWTKLQPYLTRH
jgi:hypothetical protein